MPKVKALVQQYVEQIAQIEFDVADPENEAELAQARDFALRTADQAKWEIGDDAYSVSVYAILDEDNGILWER